MATDPTRIFIPQIARLWLAPVGTIAPDGPIVAMPTGWVDVGLFTPDSLQWATDPSFETVTSHQSNYPTRRFQTSDAATLQVDLQEWSAKNFKAVFGGGDITTVTPSGGGTDYFKFAPPKVGARSTIAACIELGDGTKHVRRLIPRAEQVEGVTQSFSRTAESTLPLRLSVLGGDIGDPFYDISDFLDPAA
jgi:hypothetical protein